MRYLFYLSVLCLFLTWGVSAANLESPRFRIESPSIDFTQPPSAHQAGPLTEEEARFERLGYIDKTTATTDRVELHNSQSLINYGELDANTFIDQETQLSLVESPAVYRITLEQLSDLKKVSGATIPATRCDGGGKNCTPSVANQWRSTASYGLGYTLISTAAPLDFMNGSRFRPLSTFKKNQPVTIMQGVFQKGLITGRLIYRLNTSPAQEDGTYEHTVSILALPGY